MKKRPVYTKEELEHPMHTLENMRLTKTIKDFVETNNMTEAVMRNYDIAERRKANGLGSRILKRPEVMRVLALYAQRSILRTENIAETARSEKVRLEANLGLMDRGGYGIPKGDGGQTNNVLVINIPEVIARKNGLLAANDGERSEHFMNNDV